MTKPLRIFVVGTDTGVGKTRVSAALVRALVNVGKRVVAFKPAISGPAEVHDDLELLRAAMSPVPTREQIHAFNYAVPLAPGVAENPAAFTGEAAAPQQGTAAQATAREKLERLEQAYDAQVSVIEGAGGLRVPMPGGTWLDAWVQAFDARALVVGRLGLGTLNHTLLTFEALEARGIDALGFVLSTTLPRRGSGEADPDPSTEHNLQILERHTQLDCLGVLPHHALDEPPAHTWLRDPSFKAWF